MVGITGLTPFRTGSGRVSLGIFWLVYPLDWQMQPGVWLTHITSLGSAFFRRWAPAERTDGDERSSGLARMDARPRASAPPRARVPGAVPGPGGTPRRGEPGGGQPPRGRARARDATGGRAQGPRRADARAARARSGDSRRPGADHARPGEPDRAPDRGRGLRAAAHHPGSGSRDAGAALPLAPRTPAPHAGRGGARDGELARGRHDTQPGAEGLSHRVVAVHAVH